MSEAPELLVPHDEPGPGHARLEVLVGLWDTTTTLYGGFTGRVVESGGSVEKSWCLGGRFLREDLAGVSVDGEPYLGLGLIGHDNARDVYQGVWLGSGATGMSTFDGGWDEDDQCIRFEGWEPSPEDGQPRRFRSELRIESPDKHVLTHLVATPDGEFEPAFRIEHTRSTDPEASMEWPTR